MTPITRKQSNGRKPGLVDIRSPYVCAAHVFVRKKKLLQTMQAGFQLMELLIALAIVGITASIAFPSYTQFIDKADNATAAADIVSIAQAIERFYISNNRYPDSLMEAGFNNFLDPWDNPYQYLRIHGAGLKGKGKLRKDKKLNPINSDFDLYSMGKNGVSASPLPAKPSRDDIVRASNGGFIGLAAEY